MSFCISYPSQNRVFPTEWQGERKYANVFSYLAEPYNYYTRIFGKSITSQYLDLFFLNRRGGYALPDGIILSQEYISKNNSSFTKEEITRLVAHEVAHLWWGIGVKGKSWAITEGLAELSSDFYLSDTKKQDLRSIYATKNSVVLDSSITPVDIENLSLFNTNYKTIAYYKLPIILHEAELKTGRDNVLKALTNFYNVEKLSEKLCGFDDIISYFPAQYQPELKKDVEGTLENWPDYYIKKDQSFFETILTYLFTTKNVSIEGLANRGSASILSKAKIKLEGINVCGAYLRIRKRDQSFKITITFVHAGGFEKGWIEGFYEERNNSLRLKSIKKIKV